MTIVDGRRRVHQVGERPAAASDRPLGLGLLGEINHGTQHSHGYPLEGDAPWGYTLGMDGIEARNRLAIYNYGQTEGLG